MPASERCPFCAIATGDLPAHVIAADEFCVAFLDAAPAARGHTLVVPREHVSDLWEADADQAAALMRTTHAVASLLRAKLAPDGLTLRQNTGAASGQHVAHLHIHLVPRWHGDGHIGWPHPPQVHPDPDEIARLLAG